MKYTICENHTTVHGLLIQTLLRVYWQPRNRSEGALHYLVHPFERLRIICSQKITQDKPFCVYTEGLFNKTFHPFFRVFLCFPVCLGTVTMTAEAVKCAINSEAADRIETREIVDYYRT